MKPSAILFDLDGTLIDSALDITNICNQVATRNGYTPLPLTELNPLVGHGSRGIMARITGHSEASDTVMQLRSQVLHDYAICGYPNTRLFPQLRPMVQLLNQRTVPWGVVTSKPRHHSLDLLNRDADMRHHNVLIGLEDVQAIKPDPQGLHKAVQALGVTAGDCIYAGDNRVDVLAARHARLPCIGVGYGYCSEADHPLHYDPELYAQSPLDLARLVMSLFIQDSPRE